MSPQTYIFIGRAGSGKGTQSELLLKALKEKDPQGSVFSLEIGAKFRELIKKGTYTSQLSTIINTAGGIQPVFLSTTMWANTFIDSFKEGQHIHIDGSPRSLREAYTLDSAMKFYGRKHPFVIYLDIKNEHALERLLKRGRSDDVPHAIQKRLSWFETDVMDAIKFYQGNPDYRFLDIDGTQSIEKVRDDIFAKVF